MIDAENEKILERFESEVIGLGDSAMKGVVSEQELEEAQEIRVSVRPSTFLGSIEMFTLRKLKPADYHLMLIAIPRNQDSD